MHIVVEKIYFKKYYAVMQDKKLLLWTSSLKSAKEYIKRTP